VISAGRNYAMTEPNLGLGSRTRLLPAEKAVKNLSGARQPFHLCVCEKRIVQYCCLSALSLDIDPRDSQ